MPAEKSRVCNSSSGRRPRSASPHCDLPVPFHCSPPAAAVLPARCSEFAPSLERQQHQVLTFRQASQEQLPSLSIFSEASLFARSFVQRAAKETGHGQALPKEPSWLSAKLNILCPLWELRLQRFGDSLVEIVYEGHLHSCVLRQLQLAF
eukprot:Skav222564  [mRNA]  locus=scaffold791:161968:163919:- [translate_table: standard]